MKVVFAALASISVLTACGPAPSTVSNKSSAATAGSVALAEVPPVPEGVWIETSVLDLFHDDRIAGGAVDGDVATLKVRMIGTDTGGITEAGTTPRNVGATLSIAKKPILPEAKQFRFVIEDANGAYFGSFLFARDDLVKARTQNMNYAQIVDLSQDVKLTAIGVESARTFCAERAAEATRFCSRALASAR